MYFRDRADAGRQLADKLKDYRGWPDVLVLAVPRGGVPVGFEAARVLGAPLDVLLVRKLGVPGHVELAMGAVASGGTRVLASDVIDALNVPQRIIESVTAREQARLKWQQRAYCGDHRVPDVHGKTVIVIDDGLATGSTMRAAAMTLRQREPARLVVAVPTAARQVCYELRNVVDEIICAITPEPFYAVGAWYEDFSQTTDDDVRQLLNRAAAAHAEDSRNRAG